MAIEVGNLVVELSANVARLSQDMGRATSTVNRGMKQIEKAAGSAQNALQAIGVGVSVTAFAAWIKGAVDLEDHINDLSKQVGIGVEQLAGYRLAAAQSGTSLDDVAKSVGKLSKYMLDHNAAMKMAGVTATDSNGALLQIADMFAQMPDGIQKTALAIELFGKNGMAMIPMLNEGSAGLQAMIDKSTALAPITAEAAARADEFNDRLAEMELRSGAVAMVIGNDLMRLLQPLIEDLSALDKGSKDVGVSIHALFEVLRYGTVIGSGFMTVMKEAALVVGGLAAALAALLDTSTASPSEAFARVGSIMDSLGEDLRNATDDQAAFQARLLAIDFSAPSEKVVQLAEKQKRYLADVVAVQKAYAGFSVEIQSAAQRALAQGAYGAGAVGSGYNPAALLNNSADAAEKATDAYDGLIRSIRDKIAAEEAERANGGPLTDAQKLRVELETRMTDVLGQGVSARRTVAQADIDRLVGLKQTNDTEAAWLKMQQEGIAANEQRLKSITDQADALEQENAVYGQGKDAIEANTIARLEEQRAIVKGLGATDDQLAALDAEIAARKRLQSALSSREALDENKRAAEAAAREWQKFTDQIEQSLTDALMRGFENGNSFGKNFVESLENTLKTAALKIVVQALVDPVMGAMGGGSSVGGGAGGAGGSSSIGSGLQALSFADSLANGNAKFDSLYWSAAGSNFGKSLGLSQQIGVDQYGDAVNVMTGLGQSIKTALPYLPAVVYAAQGKYGSAIGSAAGAYFGGPIGAFLGGQVGGMADGWFGGGGSDPHNNQAVTGYHFGITQAGLYANAGGNDGTTGPTSFGAGSTSGKGWWVDDKNLSADQVKAINTAVAAVFASAGSMAKMLGVDPSVLSGASVDSRYSGSSGQGIGGYFASVEQALQALGDTLVQKIIPNLKDFQQTGETLSQTTARLVDEFTLTNSIAQMMGKNAATAIGSIANRDDLIKQLGGSGNASTAIGSYYSNFYSAAEQQKAAKNSIDATLKSIGVKQPPTTRAEYRALVEAQDLTTDAGRKMYASLISVASAFAGITDAATAAADAGQALAAIDESRFATLVDYQRAIGLTSAGASYGMDNAGHSYVLPHFAAGGDHAGGWAMVGEKGPELAYLGPSHIYSNQSSAALVDLKPLQAEIRAMRTELARIQLQGLVATKDMAARISSFDKNGLPPTRT